MAGGKIVIPSDARGLPVGAPFGSGGDDEVLEWGENIPDGFQGLDIGPGVRGDVRRDHRERRRRSCGTARWACSRIRV